MSDDTTIDVSVYESSIGDDEPVPLAIVRAVAAATESDPGELPPLYDTIDTDALQSLVGAGDRSATVQFRYGEHVVVAEAGDTVVVYPDDVSIGVPQ